MQRERVGRLAWWGVSGQTAEWVRGERSGANFDAKCVAMPRGGPDDGVRLKKNWSALFMLE